MNTKKLVLEFQFDGKGAVKNINSLDDAVGKLEKTIKNTDDALGELEKIMKESDKTLAEMSGQIEGASTINEGFNQSIKKQQEGLDKDKEAVDKLEQAFESLSNVGNQVIDALQKMGIISESLAGSLSGLTSGVSAIGGGISAIQNAGKGLTGFLQKLSGGFNLVTGAISVLSGVLSLFSGKSGELEAAERRLRGLVGVSGEWAKKIEELGKQLGRAGADRAFNQLLSDIIRDTDITIGNFDTWIDKVREIVSTYEQGFASIEETQRNYGSAFNAILEQARTLGLEGGHEMKSLILLADEFGLNVKEIKDYVAENMAEVVANWRILKEEVEGISVPWIDELVRQQQLVESIPENIARELDAATKAAQGLANAGKLTQTEFDALNTAAMDALGKIQLEGIQGQDAIIAMQPLLERLNFLRDQYNFSLDSTIEKMIDEGIQSGLIRDDIRTDTQIQIDIQGKMLEVLEKIAMKFGVEIPGAMEKMADAGQRHFENMKGTAENFKGSIDIIIGEMGDLEEKIGDVDETWEKHVTGNTIVKANEEWAESLKSIEDKMVNIADGITIFDQYYEGVTTQMTDETEKNWQKVQKAYEAAMHGMESDTIYFQNILDNMIDQLGIDIPDTLLDLQDQYDYVMRQMANATETYFLGSDGVLRDLIDTLAYIGQQTYMDIGSNYGVYDDAAKQDMTATFFQMGHLWQSNRADILASESSMSRFLRDLERLVVIDDVQAQYDKFLGSMRQWYRHLESGETWNEVTDTWLKAAAGTHFIVPPNIPEMPIIVHPGERVDVWTPEETRKMQSTTTGSTLTGSSTGTGGDTFIFQQEFQSRTVDDFVMEWKNAVKQNRYGVKNLIKEIAANVRGN